MGGYLTSHEIRIPIKQSGFNGTSAKAKMLPQRSSLLGEVQVPFQFLAKKLDPRNGLTLLSGYSLVGRFGQGKKS